MSTTRTRPAVASVIPSFASMSAAVTVARTVGVASNPLGTSTLRIGFPLLFISRIRVAYGSRISPCTPIPRSASTMRSASRNALSLSVGPSTTSTPGPSFSRFARASGVATPLAPFARSTLTRASPFRWRAATSPSPPLFPVPHATTTRFPAIENSDRATSAIPRPAASMRLRIETPKYSALRSITRCSAAVSTRPHPMASLQGLRGGGLISRDRIPPSRGGVDEARPLPPCPPVLSPRPRERRRVGRELEPVGGLPFRGDRDRAARVRDGPRDGGARQARGPRPRRSAERDVREGDGADHRPRRPFRRARGLRQGAVHGLDL